MYKVIFLKLWSKVLQIFLLFSLYFSSLNLKYLKLIKMDITRFAMKLFTCTCMYHSWDTRWLKSFYKPLGLFTEKGTTLQHYTCNNNIQITLPPPSLLVPRVKFISPLLSSNLLHQVRWSIWSLGSHPGLGSLSDMFLVGSGHWDLEIIKYKMSLQNMFKVHDGIQCMTKRLKSKRYMVLKDK